ncbi:MAG: DUF2089 domain-containing protein, partial [Anaerolineae bacterium]
MAYSMSGRCPICAGEVVVTQYRCKQCDSRVEGWFELSPLYRLTPEQMAFVETFIRCEGTIRRVEAELGISYPTVRARLRDVIRAMGYEVDERHPPNLTGADRRALHDRLDEGVLTKEG